MREANDRVTVDSLMPGGAAEHAGFEAGDEILSVNGHRVSNAAQLKRDLHLAAEADGTAAIMVSRDGKTHSLEADVSGRFAAQISAEFVSTYYRAAAKQAYVPAAPPYGYGWPYFTSYGAYPYYVYPGYYFPGYYYPWYYYGGGYPYYYSYYGPRYSAYYSYAPYGYYCW